MTAKQWLLVGCGAAALFALLVGALLVVFLAYAVEDPANVEITVDAPHTVFLGEDFTVTVLVENQRTDGEFELTDIDIADAYLDHFLVIATEPAFVSSMHIPIANTRSYTFNQRVPARETARIEFRLRPTATGLFRGDVDVCEGFRFVTTYVQSIVEPER